MTSGTKNLTAISAGLALATCCFPLLGGLVATTGAYVVVVVAVAGALAWLVSRAVAELASRYPTGAGLRTYVGAAFGRRWGVLGALLYLFLIVSLGAAETFLLAAVIKAVWPAVPAVGVIVVFIGLCAGINALGLRWTGRAQSVMTWAVMGVAGAVALAAIFGAPEPATSTPAAPLLPILAGVAPAAFLFVGFEWVVHAAAESRAGGAGVARATTGAIVALAGFYALMGLGLAFALEPAALTQAQVPHVLMGATVGTWARVAIVVASIAATLTSFNSGILGASRLVYALAREGALPRSLGVLAPRSMAPVRAIVLIGVVCGLSALLLSGAGSYALPVVVGAAIECFAFAAIAAAFARLRVKKKPARGYRAPFGVRSGWALCALFTALGVASVATAGDWAWPAAAALLGALVIAAAATAWAERRDANARRLRASIE